MSDVDRYPTWALLLAAIALAAAVVLRYMILDRGSNPRRLWLMLLTIWLAVIGLAATGVFRTRSGGSIMPNEPLLVLADLMAGLLVVSVPLGRALRRLTDDQLQQLRVGNALQAVLGRPQTFAVVALVFGTLAALLVGESALAAKLPRPPAVVACQEYETWLLAPGNGTMPPANDQAMVARAAHIAPPGDLRLDLATLAADVQSAISDGGTAQGILDYGRILSDESKSRPRYQDVAGQRPDRRRRRLGLLVVLGGSLAGRDLRARQLAVERGMKRHRNVSAADRACALTTPLSGTLLGGSATLPRR